MHPSVTYGESNRILGLLRRVAALRHCLDLTCVKRSPYAAVAHRRRTLQNMPSASGELA